MGLNNFYTYTIYKVENENIWATIVFNPEHEIYQGHFPGTPITPGACLIEITRKVFSDLKKTEMLLHTAKEIKFRRPIIPMEHKAVNLHINFRSQDSLYHIQAIFSSGDTEFSKIKGTVGER